MDALTPCGAGISLMPNGFRALNAIHPKLLAGVRDVTVTLEAINQYTANGKASQVIFGAFTVTLAIALTLSCYFTPVP